MKSKKANSLCAITALFVIALSLSGSTTSFALTPAGSEVTTTQPVVAPADTPSPASSASTIKNQLMSTDPQEAALSASLPESVKIIPAPSNSNFIFTTIKTAAGGQAVFLGNLKTGEKSLLMALPPPPINTQVTFDNLDVSPDGTMAVVNIKKDSPYTLPGTGHTGVVLMYNIPAHTINKFSLGQVSPVNGANSPYVFRAGMVLFNVTSDIFNGDIVIHAEWGHIIGPDFTGVNTPRLLLSQGVSVTPQNDKIVVGSSLGLRDSILTYDLPTKGITYSPLAHFGYGGIKAISPDGKTAIVASSRNIFYLVPVGINALPKLFVIPVPPGQSTSDYALVTASFNSAGTYATLTLRNGYKYSLDLMTLKISRCEIFFGYPICPSESNINALV